MRKEKYIKVKQYKGNTYFTVQFVYGEKWDKRSYSKTFNSADYDTPAQALNEACKHRDIKRAELLTSGLPTRRMTVLTAYEKSKEIFVRADSTIENMDAYFKRFFEPYANMPMNEIDEFTILAHLESLRSNKSDIVIGKVFNMWKRICKTAKGLKAITSNPADGVEAPHSTVHKEPRKQSFTDEEVNAVIARLRTPTPNEGWTYNRYVLSVMIVVARFTGLRPREIKYLEREDVDFATDTLFVKPHGKNIKTRASIRTVPLNGVVKAELMTLFSISPYELPFSFNGGLIPTPNTISRTIRIASLEAGVPGFHLYGMRHSFDSELITNGVDPRTVMELMGHTNVNTTLAVYARSTDEKRKEAIRLVEGSRKPA